MELLVTRTTGTKSLYSFDSISRTKGTDEDNITKDCTVLLNGASIVQYIFLTKNQHNKFVDLAFGGQQKFELVFSKDGFELIGIPASVAPTMVVDGSTTVSFEVGKSSEIKVKFTGESVDFTPETEWVSQNGNIKLTKNSETSATITSTMATSGNVVVKLKGTEQTITFNVTVNALTPPNISAVGETTIALETGATSDITVALSGGSSGYVSDIEYTSDNACATVLKKTNTTATITSVSAGSANITAKIKGTNKSVVYTVNITDPVVPQP